MVDQAVVVEGQRRPGLEEPRDPHDLLAGQRAVRRRLLATPVNVPLCAVDGPEAWSQSGDNRYAPEWIALEDMDTANLQPQTLRELLRQLR